MQAESGGGSYDRDLCTHWIDANKDCQKTRAEVLISESQVTPTYSRSRCSVVRGKWYSYYDGMTWTDPLDVDIDHLVALKEAWDSGARSWSAADRTAFANDIAFWPSLVAVNDNVNSAEGASDPVSGCHLEPELDAPKPSNGSR